MTALNRKLLRDILGMKGQTLAIAIVIMSGIAMNIMSMSTMRSLQETRESYYRQYRFPDLFSNLKRAPVGLKNRILDIPGVDAVDTRVIAPVKLKVEGFSDPIAGLLVSVPDSGKPELNDLFIRSGRIFTPGSSDECLVNETFSLAHGLVPGDKVSAVINGKKRQLTIAGIALTPEFIFQMSPGNMFPDYKRYGILWMPESALASAFDMKGSFNDTSLRLSTGANEKDVIDRLDIILEPYGGLGAYGRENHISHRFLSEEFKQLASMAVLYPVIFLSVAAFLLSVVLNRLIGTQRDQIAVLKAFGYSGIDIGIHYVKLVLIISTIGSLMGVGVGMYLGTKLGNMYMDFYHFPFFRYKIDADVIYTAVLISAAATVVGTVMAVRKAVKLPPAEAMRPEAPAQYSVSIIERIGLKHLISEPTRMIIRHIGRRPVKSIFSVIGISFACAIVVLGSFFGDAINMMVAIQFGIAQRDDLSVSFNEPVSSRALGNLRNMQGVQYVEPFREVAVQFFNENRSYRTSIRGVQRNGDLFRVLDKQLKPIDMPPFGIVLSERLSKILSVKPGDILRVKLMEGDRSEKSVPVAAVISQYVGISTYMEIGALNGFMKESDIISGAMMKTDSDLEPNLFEKLHNMPRVAGLNINRFAIANFHENMSKQITIFNFFISILAMTIAFGVVYNSARIALSERSRELGSLRVLGFTRGEISYILLGELFALTMAAVPLGFLIGRGLAAYLIKGLENDLFTIPMVIEPSTYAFATSVLIVSTILSSLVVKSKLDNLDLVAVLKTRE